MLEPWQIGGFGVYVHWPFCESKCPYCDFNSHVAKTIDHHEWREAYAAEIDRQAAPLAGRVLTSVFFGGGTPSLMEPETISLILDHLGRHFTFANDIEITLEANPSSIERERFREFAKSGINRVSLGVQSLHDDDLRRLGRLHSADDARHALDIARNQFDRVSFDLIYARQHQTPELWEKELSAALSYDPDHLSLYQLTIEDGTAFGDRFARGKLPGLPSETSSVEMYEITNTLCEKADLPAYEVSNHARHGSESRHNLIYWNSGDYLGIGPGAHGRITVDHTRFETSTVLSPAAWINDAKSGPAWTQMPLSREAWGIEHVLMGLRLNQPYDLERLSRETGLELPSHVIEDLVRDNLISTTGTTLEVTQKGRPLLNAILLKLLES